MKFVVRILITFIAVTLLALATPCANARISKKEINKIRDNVANFCESYDIEIVNHPEGLFMINKVPEFIAMMDIRRSEMTFSLDTYRYKNSYLYNNLVNEFVIANGLNVKTVASMVEEAIKSTDEYGEKHTSEYPKRIQWMQTDPYKYLIVWSITGD